MCRVPGYAFITDFNCLIGIKSRAHLIFNPRQAHLTLDKKRLQISHPACSTSQHHLSSAAIQTIGKHLVTLTYQQRTDTPQLKKKPLNELGAKALLR
jgi:hypothetical protein